MGMPSSRPMFGNMTERSQRSVTVAFWLCSDFVETGPAHLMLGLLFAGEWFVHMWRPHCQPCWTHWGDGAGVSSEGSAA